MSAFFKHIKGKGLTQKKFAELYGIDKNTVSRLVHGKPVKSHIANLIHRVTKLPLKKIPVEIRRAEP